MAIEATEYIWRPAKVVTSSNRYQGRAASIMLTNTGNADVLLDGMVTIPANGGCKSYDSDGDGIIIIETVITFGAGDNPRLEIEEMEINKKGRGNYTER